MMIKQYLHISLNMYIHFFLKNMCVAICFGTICAMVVNLNPLNFASDYLILIVYGVLAFVIYLVAIYFLYRKDSIVSETVFQFYS